jgi:hypothetical protein
VIIINVEITFTIGVAPARIKAKRYTGKVWADGPEQKNESIKSSKETINTSNADAIKEGNKKGNTTYCNVCARVAPKSYDASSNR